MNLSDPENEKIAELLLEVLVKSMDGVLEQLQESADTLFEPGSFLAGSMFAMSMNQSNGDSQAVIDFFAQDFVKKCIAEAREKVSL